MLEDKIALTELEQLAQDLIKDKSLIGLKKMALLRNAAIDKDLRLRDQELIQLLAQARSETKGDGEEPNVLVDVPEESWVWDLLIAEGNLNILTSLQKVGKSSFLAGFFGALTHGSTEYLGQSLKGGSRPLILVGTDQSLKDWTEILVPAGLMQRVKDQAMILDPIKKLWHKSKPLHLNEHGIESICALAEKHPKAIILIDSFASVISGLGLDENTKEATEPIRLLCESLPPDATPILIHHSSKSRSHERASNAARGNNALTAEASQIIQLEWLSPESKQDQRICVTTEARNSTPFDLVIEQVARSQWVAHGSKSSIQEKLNLEKIESKLSERQSLVLAAVRNFWDNNLQGITSATLAQDFSSEFGDQPAVKALANLKQLEAKGLIHSQKVILPKRGNVLLFKPSS